MTGVCLLAGAGRGCWTIPTNEFSKVPNNGAHRSAESRRCFRFSRLRSASHLPRRWLGGLQDILQRFLCGGGSLQHPQDLQAVSDDVVSSVTCGIQQDSK